MCKYFRFTFEYALYQISYANLMMLLNTIPVYKKAGDDEPGGHVDEVNSVEDLMKLGIK